MCELVLARKDLVLHFMLLFTPIVQWKPSFLWKSWSKISPLKCRQCWCQVLGTKCVVLQTCSYCSALLAEAAEPLSTFQKVDRNGSAYIRSALINKVHAGQNPCVHFWHQKSLAKSRTELRGEKWMNIKGCSTSQPFYRVQSVAQCLGVIQIDK